MWIQEERPLYFLLQDSLDDFLLVHTKAWRSFSPIDTDFSKEREGLVFYPIVVSRDLERLVMHNFEVLREFAESLCTFQNKTLDKSFIRHALLDNIHRTLKEVLLIFLKSCFICLSVCLALIG